MSRAANLRSDITKANAVARNRRGCEKNARTQIPGGIRATVHVETSCLTWTIINAVISAAIEFVAVVAVAVADDIVVDGIATVDVADVDNQHMYTTIHARNRGIHKLVMLLVMLLILLQPLRLLMLTKW